VLALLAFLAVLPVIAQADETSSGVEYDPALPTAEGSSSDPPRSTGGAEAPAEAGSTGSVEGSYTEEVPSGSGSGGAATGSDGGTGQGSPDKGATPPGEAGLQPADPVATSNASSGGGSSPLVAILIAILALAAISLGAVLIRQRRQRRDSDGTRSPLSTKAG
jgi:hypothetical protein